MFIGRAAARRLSTSANKAHESGSRGRRRRVNNVNIDFLNFASQIPLLHRILRIFYKDHFSIRGVSAMQNRTFNLTCFCVVCVEVSIHLTCVI